jgi:hypothetical protein
MLELLGYMVELLGSMLELLGSMRVKNVKNVNMIVTIAL